MTDPAFDSAVLSSDAIDSIQLRGDGTTPRFQVVPWGDRFDWLSLAESERTEGVEASVRLFLDLQLETGDLVVDLDPGAGFVTLSAATSEAEPHVVCVADDEAHAQALKAVAEAADVFLELVVRGELGDDELVGLVADRLLDGQRVFVHASPSRAAEWLGAFAPLADGGRVVAWCQGGEATADAVALAHAALRAHGFVPHVLAERRGEAELFAAPDAVPECIALHASVCAVEEAPEPPAPRAMVHEAPAAVGLHFIAPFCRTGYGIAGAHLLRALLLRGAPASFFPLGAIDSSILPFAGLTDALARQDSYDSSAPSVRLSQQFDLALHVGRGPRVGFPIFELTQFSPRERHHLASQDQLLVCSEWARGVLLENGVWKAPIHVVPLGVDRDVFHERLDAGRSTSDTVFLQVGKLEPRKGQLELLRAFEAAFSPRDAVQLVVACHNPFLGADAFARATGPFRASPMARRITLVTKPLPTQSDVARLMASADCGVFVSRAEGWNLEALEMLSVGRPVIATNYSAHTAFLTPDNARLIDVGTPEQASGHPDGARWAGWGAAQHEQLVEQLRAVHQARQVAPLPVNHSGLETARRCSWDASAEALLRAISQL